MILHRAFYITSLVLRNTKVALFFRACKLSYTTFVYSWNNDMSIVSYSIESLTNDNDDEHQVLIRLFCVNVTKTGDIVLAFITSSNTTMNG